jgi:SAM-dependent methyltransferase
MLTPSETLRAEDIRSSGKFRVEDIPMMTRVFEAGLVRPTADMSYFAGTSMELPAWYDRNLSPDSDAYTQQQLRLWRVVSGRDRDYQPEIDEKEVDVDSDPVRFPAFYAHRGAGAMVHAADHMLATTQMLRHSNVTPGAWALEYGAGYGQTALAFSRLGVNVDTVDISRQFCKYVKANADFFRTKLTPHVGRFGDNPRGDKKYDLIYFFEAFHHALDFRGVLEKVKSHLAPRGRLLLCGEPVTPVENAWWTPYPWGLRIDGDTVPVMRSRGWLELGFTHAYLMSVLERAGFRVEYTPSAQTPLANIYVCEHRSEATADFPAMASQPTEASTWHGADPAGRWSKDRSVLRFTTKKEKIVIDVVNFLPVAKTLTVENGGSETRFEFKAGESRVISVPNNGDTVVFTCEAHSPASLSGGEIPDQRKLGLYVRSVYSY